MSKSSRRFLQYWRRLFGAKGQGFQSDDVRLQIGERLPLDWENAFESRSRVTFPRTFKTRHGAGTVLWSHDGSWCCFSPYRAEGVLVGGLEKTVTCHASRRSDDTHFCRWRRESDDPDRYVPGDLIIGPKSLEFKDAEDVPPPSPHVTDLDWIESEENIIQAELSLERRPHTWLRLQAALAEDSDFLRAILSNSFSISFKRFLIANRFEHVESGEEVFSNSERRLADVVAELRCLGEDYMDFWHAEPSKDMPNDTILMHEKKSREYLAKAGYRVVSDLH